MCEYCNKRINNKKIKDVDNDKEDGIHITFLDKPYLNVELETTDENGYKAEDFFRINYCPMCR